MYLVLNVAKCILIKLMFLRFVSWMSWLSVTGQVLEAAFQRIHKPDLFVQKESVVFSEIVQPVKCCVCLVQPEICH